VIVRLLPNAKANINAKDFNEKTALYWVAVDGDEALVQLLLEVRLLLKANVYLDADDSDGMVALHWAVEHGTTQ
jgi:ankyrin repeat protein